jgi:Fe2+ transport system protein FeoA
VVPLETLNRGEWAEIVDVGGAPTWVGRLAEIGLRVGAKLRMLQPGCPCLFQVGHSRLSLRLEEASHILVQPLAAHALAAEVV